MSTTPDLIARVEALEKAVQSLLGAVKILETIQENGSRKPAKRRSAAGRNAASTKKAASKKHGTKKATAW